MKVIVTGAAGYLGSRLADYLLSKDSGIKISQLVLADAIAPTKRADPRVTCVQLDLGQPDAADRLLDHNCNVLFHLAAIVSGHAEADFDLGMRVNFDATRQLLETARRKSPSLIFVFTSTVGVFGGELPTIVDERTAVTPETSYGVAKAMSELLACEYARRGFVDTRVVRLPTVSVRAGTANRAVTSFASGIVREPLNGSEAVCPVDDTQELWLTSPATVVRNIAYTATLPKNAVGVRPVNLPGLRVSVHNMLKALKTVAGAETVSRVRFERDDNIARMVASFPVAFDNSRALNLGFVADQTFEDIIKSYIKNDLGK